MDRALWETIVKYGSVPASFVYICPFHITIQIEIGEALIMCSGFEPGAVRL